MFALLFSLFSCADFSLAAKNEATDGAGNDTAREGDADTATDAAEDAVWYAPAAFLSVVAGQAVTDGASVRLRLARADRTDIHCDLDLSVSGLAVATSPDPAIAFWWELPITGSGTSDCARITLPAKLGLGVGPLDPEVRARLGTVDREDEADGLSGAFARIDSGDVVAIGYAAPEDTSIEATNPPADGDYDLEPVFLLPAPD